MNAVSRSGNLSPYLRGTSSVATVKTIIPSILISSPPLVVDKSPEVHTSATLRKIIPARDVKVLAGPLGKFNL